jgi:hypothetical protein
MSFHDAIRTASEATLTRVGRALDGYPDDEQWMSLASKTLRHQLRLAMQGEAIDVKKKLRAKLEEIEYLKKATSIDRLVEQSISFRAFPETHTDLLRRTRRVTLVCTVLAPVIAVAMLWFGLGVLQVLMLALTLATGAASLTMSRLSNATWCRIMVLLVGRRALRIVRSSALD